jgi:hypothetical protein
MAVRGDEVAGSIEAHVREAIERMVGEIRSSVEDVRAAVDSQLKAALQSVQADVNSISFLPHIQKSIGELEAGLKAAAPPPPPAAADASRVKQAVQAVEQSRSQIDVLNALLEQCLEFGSRAALLILRGETFSGWKGVGFSAHGGNDESVKRFNAAPGLIPELDRVLRNEQVVIWDGANLSTRLGVSPSQRAVLVPMVIKDKVAAAVYVDATAQDASKLDATSVELLVFTTGLLIDTLSIRKKTPSPSLTESDQTAAAAPAPPPPVHKPEHPTSSSTVAITAAQMREMISPSRPELNFQSVESSLSTTAIPAVQTPPPPPPPPRPVAPLPPPTPPPAQPPAHEDQRPSTQYVPPAGIRGSTSLGGAQSEEGKKHDEARRFARLLVSEIKLYNEGKVEQGRKNKDLYERLKEDIDRSRQMYDERIPDEVRKASNYFYDELVRILADGDAGSLGL